MAASLCYTALLVLTVITISSFVSSLVCYQCVDSGDDVDCQDARGLLNTTNATKKDNFVVNGEPWKGNRYFKNCTLADHEWCMIETFESGGAIKSYHRDCSDGKSFSFKPDLYPRLSSLPTDNKTKCAYSSTSNMVVCVRLCKGDMCNGPIPLKEPEIECRNETNAFGDTYEVCGATSHFPACGIVVLSSILIYVVTSLGDTQLYIL